MFATPEQLIAAPISRYPQATVACFDPTRGNLPRRQLDERRTIAMLERFAALKVPAVLIASSTGQGHLRTVNELQAWFDCAARAELGDTMPIALLRPEDGLTTNQHLLDHLAKKGYPVVFFRPGTDLDPDEGDTAVQVQLAPLIEAAADRGLAIGLYSISDVSGQPLSADVSAALVDGTGGDHIVAIKVTETDYHASTVQFLKHPALKDLKIVQGWDPHISRALHEGPGYDAAGRQRVGITSGMMALAIHQYLHLMASAERQDWDELDNSIAAASRLFEAMQDDPQHFADLQRAKYVMGLGQPLTTTVTDDQAEAIIETIASLPRQADRRRLARSLDLMGAGPWHQRLIDMAS